jgi:hypothetical protein
MKFDDYLGNRIEYPRPASEPLAPGVCYSYISSTFLNGWINYTGDVRKAFLVQRYRSPGETAEALAEWIKDPPIHPDFGDLGDDVHLVTKDETGRWWYYHYDRDCSDCDIGILESHGDDDATVLAAFEEWVCTRFRNTQPYQENIENGGCCLAEIPLETIRGGWISG